MKIASSQVNMNNDYKSEFAAARYTKAVQAPGSTRVELSQEAQDAQALIRARQDRRENAEQNNQQAVNQNIQTAQAQTGQGLQREEFMMISASEQFSTQKSISSQTGPDGTTASMEEISYYDQSISIMKMILERLTGEPIDLFSSEELSQRAASQARNGVVDPSGNPQVPVEGDAAAPNQWIQVTNYQYEKQSNQLEFSGTIEQEDGTSTSFSLNVGFSQEYEKISTEVIQQGQLKDPLVISFSSKPVSLSDEKMQFDIDADGQQDSIAQLKAGFGFLALDKNGDNQINDGTELFGALSGNGFADLAQYDDDQNGYIDENDEIFDKLQIWVKNENEDKLVSLKEAGIGAIATENVDSPMNIRDSNGEERLGVIQKSGYYLNEDGKAGLIQQLDFVV